MRKTATRGRGRPHGSGLDDTPTLTRMADMIARTPSLRPTTALRTIDPDVNPATKRRIQAKWRVQGMNLLSAAHAGNASPAPIASVRKAPCAFGQAATYHAAMEISRVVAESAKLGSLISERTFSKLQAVQAVYDSPAMRKMREVSDSPEMRKMREIQDSLLLRSLADYQNSPVMHAVGVLGGDNTIGRSKFLR